MLLCSNLPLSLLFLLVFLVVVTSAMPLIYIFAVSPKINLFHRTMLHAAYFVNCLLIETSQFGSYLADQVILRFVLPDKPDLQDLQYFLKFQAPLQWAPLFNELVLIIFQRCFLLFSVCLIQIWVHVSEVATRALEDASDHYNFGVNIGSFVMYVCALVILFDHISDNSRNLFVNLFLS